MKRTTTLNLTTNSKGLLKALSVPLAELEERIQANFVRLAQLGYEPTEMHHDAFQWRRSEGIPVRQMTPPDVFKHAYGKGLTEETLAHSKELEAISNKVREELIKNAMVVYGD